MTPGTSYLAIGITTLALLGFYGVCAWLFPDRTEDEPPAAPGLSRERRRL